MSLIHIISSETTHECQQSTLPQPAQRPSQTSQDQPSDQTPEGKPQSQVFISALSTLNIIHSSHNTPSLFKLALS